MTASDGSTIKFIDAKFLPGSGLLAATSCTTKGGRLELWEPHAWTLVRTIPGAARIKGASRDGGHLLVTGERQQAVVLDTGTWQPVWSTARTLDAALNPGGRSVAVIRAGIQGNWIEIEAIPRRRVEARYEAANELSGFSTDGRFLAAGEQDGLGPWLLDLRHPTRRKVPVPRDKGRTVSAMAWSARAGHVWTGDDRGVLSLYECPGWRTVWRAGGPVGEIQRIDVSPDDQWVATSARGDRVDLWAAAAGRLVQSAPTETPFPGVAFSEDGGMLVVPSGNRLDVYRRHR